MLVLIQNQIIETTSPYEYIGNTPNEDSMKWRHLYIQDTFIGSQKSGHSLIKTPFTGSQNVCIKGICSTVHTPFHAKETLPDNCSNLGNPEILQPPATRHPLIQQWEWMGQYIEIPPKTTPLPIHNPVESNNKGQHSREVVLFSEVEKCI